MKMQNNLIHGSKSYKGSSRLFGGLFVGGITALVFVLFPGLFPSSTHLEVVSGIGFLIGLSLHRTVNQIPFRFFGTSLITYFILAQITLLARKGQMEMKSYRELVKELLQRYLLQELK